METNRKTAILRASPSKKRTQIAVPYLLNCNRSNDLLLARAKAPGKAAEKNVKAEPKAAPKARSGLPGCWLLSVHV